MDPFFFSDHDELQFLWSLSEDPNVDLLDAVTQHHSRPPSSSFSKYTGTTSVAPPGVLSSTSRARGGDGRNIHRRIIELLRRMQRGKQSVGGSSGGGESSRGGEGSRVFRHMMRERQRRERLSQSYADLYAMLSARTKADKNSIVQTAAALVRELKGVKEGLQKRNEELMKIAAPVVSTAATEGTSVRVEERMELAGGEGRVITVRAESSMSAMDSVIGALRCLERMDVQARVIRTEFAGGGGGGGMIGGVMTIETNEGSGALEMEENMERMLAVEGWRSLK